MISSVVIRCKSTKGGKALKSPRDKNTRQYPYVKWGGKGEESLLCDPESEKIQSDASCVPNAMLGTRSYSASVVVGSRALGPRASTSAHTSTARCHHQINKYLVDYYLPYLASLSIGRGIPLATIHRVLCHYCTTAIYCRRTRFGPLTDRPPIELHNKLSHSISYDSFKWFVPKSEVRFCC